MAVEYGSTLSVYNTTELRELAKRPNGQTGRNGGSKEPQFHKPVGPCLGLDNVGIAYYDKPTGCNAAERLPTGLYVG